MLGKPVEVLSMMQGHAGLTAYLEKVDALPLRDYVPAAEETQHPMFRNCCKGHITRAEPDDDINYSVLALLMLEQYGRELSTENVARSWMNYLPAAATFTAERAAYAVLTSKADLIFSYGGEPGFDLAECADNEWNDWIGAQIRADVYGWVCPGDAALAAELARRDAALSHRGEGIYGAVFVAALGAAIPASDSLEQACDTALQHIPADSDAAGAVQLARSLVGSADAVSRIHERYKAFNAVHTVNNLSLVVWALLSFADDFSAAIGNVVAAGWDTDCNGATVGGLWGLQGKPIPDHWVVPWQGRVAVNLAMHRELALRDLVDRTIAVARGLRDGAGSKEE
jgi:ADP-ribosylglycohydrolase